GPLLARRRRAHGRPLRGRRAHALAPGRDAPAGADPHPPDEVGRAGNRRVATRPPPPALASPRAALYPLQPSNAARDVRCGPLTQSAECHVHSVEVTGSNPVWPTTFDSSSIAHRSSARFPAPSAA